MKVLLDECLPRRLKQHLPGHAVTTVPEKRWASIKNGALLRLAMYNTCGGGEMTITISPELEARLKERASQEGKDPDSMAETLLSEMLDWEQWERHEAIAGIQRGLDASAAGRVRPAAAVFAEMRARLAQSGR